MASSGWNSSAVQRRCRWLNAHVLENALDQHAVTGLCKIDPKDALAILGTLERRASNVRGLSAYILKAVKDFPNVT